MTDDAQHPRCESISQWGGYRCALPMGHNDSGRHWFDGLSWPVNHGGLTAEFSDHLCPALEGAHGACELPAGHEGSHDFNSPIPAADPAKDKQPAPILPSDDDPLCSVCGRDNRNKTHDALELTGHLSHEFTAQKPFPVITLCGSTKFKNEFLSENARLTMEGNLVISLGLFGHTDLPDYDWSTDVTDLKTTLDRMHFAKIDMADSVHVVNPGGYIGESTAREIAYAESKGKPVTYMEPAPAPQLPWEADNAAPLWRHRVSGLIWTTATIGTWAQPDQMVGGYFIPADLIERLRGRCRCGTPVREDTKGECKWHEAVQAKAIEAILDAADGA